MTFPFQSLSPDRLGLEVSLVLDVTGSSEQVWKSGEPRLIKVTKKKKHSAKVLCSIKRLNSQLFLLQFFSMVALEIATKHSRI